MSPSRGSFATTRCSLPNLATPANQWGWFESRERERERERDFFDCEIPIRLDFRRLLTSVWSFTLCLSSWHDALLLLVQ